MAAVLEDASAGASALWEVSRPPPPDISYPTKDQVPSEPKESFFDSLMYVINNGFDIPTVFTVIGFCIFMCVLIGIGVFIYLKLKRDLNKYKKVREAIDLGSSPLPPVEGKDGKDGQSAYELYVIELYTAELYIGIPPGSTIIYRVVPPVTGDGVVGDYCIDTVLKNRYGPKTLSGWGAINTIVSDNIIIFNGIVPPTLSIGTNGDYYIDTVLNHIYGPKTTGGWGAFTTIAPPSETVLSKTAWEAKFNGSDGAHGADAPIALDGAAGDHGSVGDIGVKGRNGAKGNAGASGVKGVEGDSFITFTASNEPPIIVTPPKFPPVLPEDFGPSFANDSPPGFPSCEFMDYNTLGKAKIHYFYQKKRLFVIEVNSPTTVAPNVDGYISFIIYDDKYRIIGFTSPLNITGIDPVSNLDIQLKYINTAVFNNKLSFRGILSLNKGLTMSSFTDNVIEKSLSDSSFTFTRPNETDAFVKKFYDIIEANPTLKENDDVFKEKIVISKTSVSTTLNTQLFPTPFNISM